MFTCMKSVGMSVNDWPFCCTFKHMTSAAVNGRMAVEHSHDHHYPSIITVCQSFRGRHRGRFPERPYRQFDWTGGRPFH